MAERLRNNGGTMVERLRNNGGTMAERLGNNCLMRLPLRCASRRPGLARLAFDTHPTEVRLEFATAMERSGMAYLKPLSRWSGVR